MSIFNGNTTGGRLLNQEWDSHRQARHMRRQLEQSREEEAEATEEKARAAAESDAMYESAKKDVIKYRTQFYVILDKLSTAFDATDDEYYMRDELNDAWTEYLHAYKRGELPLLDAERMNSLAPLYRVAKEVGFDESSHVPFRNAFREAVANNLFALPTMAEMVAAQEAEEEAVRAQAQAKLQEEQRIKAEKQAEADKEPLHWFKQLIAWPTLIASGLTMAMVTTALGAMIFEGEVEGDLFAWMVTIVMIAIPLLASYNALFNREYNHIKKAQAQRIKKAQA